MTKGFGAGQYTERSGRLSDSSVQYYKRLIRAQQPVNVQSQQKKTVSGRRGDQEEQGVAQGVRLWDGYSLKHSDHQFMAVTRTRRA